MSPEVFDVFQELVLQHPPRGPILEIGATPETTLLTLPALDSTLELVAINPDSNICSENIQVMSAHDLSVFESNYFSMILCNSVWEHDLFFWKSLAEMTRVCQVGGTLIIGVPSFGKMRDWSKTLGSSRSWLRYLLPQHWAASSLTLGLHHYPDDFYRFSATAITALLSEDWQVIEQITCMQPPRIITVARKKECN